MSALNVTSGLYLDEGGHVYPVTNWFDEDEDECPRAGSDPKDDSAGPKDIAQTLSGDS